MYEQTVKILIAFDKQHYTIAMLLTSWSFSPAKPYGKKHKLLRSGWPAAAPQGYFRPPKYIYKYRREGATNLTILYLHKSHNTPLLPPKFCIIVVGNFSWDMKMSYGKSKTMLMQIFLGVEAVCYGILQVENETIHRYVNRSSSRRNLRVFYFRLRLTL